GRSCGCDIEWLLCMCVRLYFLLLFVFFIDVPLSEIYNISLHDALPIWKNWPAGLAWKQVRRAVRDTSSLPSLSGIPRKPGSFSRSEKHTSELQSHLKIV